MVEVCSRRWSGYLKKWVPSSEAGKKAISEFQNYKQIELEADWGCPRNFGGPSKDWTFLNKKKNLLEDLNDESNSNIEDEVVE